MRAAPAPAPGGVVVAFDGSEEACRALTHAAAVVGPGGRLTVVNVIPVQSVGARLETVTEKERERQRELLRKVETLLARSGIDPVLVAAAGDPFTEILAVADSLGASTIVVGRKTRRRRLHSALGDRLVRRAACDVMVVH
jgi:nucleotide-binding universal stress UspA family protein